MSVFETRKCENAALCTGPLNTIQRASDYNISSISYDDKRACLKKPLGCFEFELLQLSHCLLI